jgi:hypothetical protein
MCNTCRTWCSLILETVSSLIVSYPEKNNQQEIVLVGNDQFFELE